MNQVYGNKCPLDLRENQIAQGIGESALLIEKIAVSPETDHQEQRRKNCDDHVFPLSPNSILDRIVK